MEVREGLPVPDLLHAQARLGVDHRALEEILGLAFLGREIGTQVHDSLARGEQHTSSWNPDFFSDDLFLAELVRASFGLEIGGRSYPVNRGFLVRVLRNVPTDSETIHFRQQILRELDGNEELLTRTVELYQKTFDFLSLTKTPGYGATLDAAAFRLDVLRQAKTVIDLMFDGFADCDSGLRRIHDSAAQIRDGAEYRALDGLLAYEREMARLRLGITVGGDGRIRHVDVIEVAENRDNPFFVNPLRRFIDRIRLVYRGYPMSQRELMNRLVNTVFQRLSPYLVPLVQLLGHIELYLTARSFRERARAAGLHTCLPCFDQTQPPQYADLFKPTASRTAGENRSHARSSRLAWSRSRSSPVPIRAARLVYCRRSA